MPVPRPAPPAAPTPPDDDGMVRMGLFDHLDELRRRIVNALAAVAVGFLACWFFVEEIAELLARPLYRLLPEGTRLAFLGITDPFVLYVKIAALAGLFLAFPVVLYQVWAFVAPGLYRRERRWAAPFIILGTLFFAAGGAFAYFVAFPFAIQFLLDVGEAFQPVITVERYFKFMLYVVFGLGVMFELPIVIFLFAQMGLVTPRFLMRHFRWAVLLIFVAAAVITPTPDIVNLCVFALPTIALYLLGVGAAALVQLRSPAPLVRVARIAAGGAIALVAGLGVPAALIERAGWLEGAASLLERPSVRGAVGAVGLAIVILAEVAYRRARRREADPAEE